MRGRREMDGGAYHYFVEDTSCSVGHFVEFIDTANTAIGEYEGTTGVRLTYYMGLELEDMDLPF